MSRQSPYSTGSVLSHAAPASPAVSWQLTSMSRSNSSCLLAALRPKQLRNSLRKDGREVDLWRTAQQTIPACRKPTESSNSRTGSILIRGVGQWNQTEYSCYSVDTRAFVYDYSQDEYSPPTLTVCKTQKLTNAEKTGNCKVQQITANLFSFVRYCGQRPSLLLTPALSPYSGPVRLPMEKKGIGRCVRCVLAACRKVRLSRSEQLVEYFYSAPLLDVVAYCLA